MCSYLELHVVQIQLSKASFSQYILIDCYMAENTFSNFGLEIILLYNGHSGCILVYIFSNTTEGFF